MAVALGSWTPSRRSSRPTSSHVYGVRGSLIAASLESMRQLGHYESYLQALEPAFYQPVVFCLVSSWVPVDVALAHYAACDALGFTHGELACLGELVAQRVSGFALQRTGHAQEMSSPRCALYQYAEVWARLLRGGRCMVREGGDKDALLESETIPVLRHVSFRQTMLAVARRTLSAATTRAFVKELAGSCHTEQLRIAVRWL